MYTFLHLNGHTIIKSGFSRITLSNDGGNIRQPSSVTAIICHFNHQNEIPSCDSLQRNSLRPGVKLSVRLASFALTKTSQTMTNLLVISNLFGRLRQPVICEEIPCYFGSCKLDLSYSHNHRNACKVSYIYRNCSGVSASFGMGTVTIVTVRNHHHT